METFRIIDFTKVPVTWTIVAGIVDWNSNTDEW